MKAACRPLSSITEQLLLGSHIVPTSATPSVSQLFWPQMFWNTNTEQKCQIWINWKKSYFVSPWLHVRSFTLVASPYIHTRRSGLFKYRRGTGSPDKAGIQWSSMNFKLQQEERIKRTIGATPVSAATFRIWCKQHGRMDPSCLVLAVCPITSPDRWALMTWVFFWPRAALYVHVFWWRHTTKLQLYQTALLNTTMSSLYSDLSSTEHLWDVLESQTHITEV